MAKYSQVVNANGTYLLGYVHRRSSADYFLATLFAYGTFGGATVTYYKSYDGGTNLIQILDLTSVAIAFTTNSEVNLMSGNTSVNNTPPQIYAIVTGAGGTTNLNIGFLDNK